MKFSKFAFIILVCFAVGSPAAAQTKKLQVVCTLPTLKALTEEIGGERVEVIALAKGDQDPHFVTPTPVLMQRTRSANLFIENGFSLELWADQVANGSGNSRIFRGTPGRIVAGNGIAAMEVPTVVTREMGDIHPQGNPHVWLDPLLAKTQAGNIANALKAADPAGAAYYDGRKADFFKRIDAAMFGPELLEQVGIQKLTRLVASGQLQSFLDENKVNGQPLASKAGGWLRAAAPLKGIRVFEFHKVWAYFARAFGFQIAGTIEEKPGIPPGPQHVLEVTRAIQAEKIPLILVDNFYDPSLPNRVAEQTGSKVVLLPDQVAGEPGIKTYFDLIDHIIRQMTAALKK